MSEGTPFPLEFAPGIMRDKTMLDSDGLCVDGQWVRWINGRARKMLGYRASNLSAPANATSRCILPYWRGTNGFYHSGHTNGIEQATFDITGNAITINDRTPVGFATNAANNWQLVRMYNQVDNNQMIIAHCTNNMDDIGGGNVTPIYYGIINGSGALTTTFGAGGGLSIDGGIMALYPFLVAYGGDGLIRWSNAGAPATFPVMPSQSAYQATQKFVRGLQVRAGGSGTSGLLWSLNSVVLMRYVGGTAIWEFTTISDFCDILSSNAVVEMGGKYFWPGTNNFWVYDGNAVRELENKYNKDFFYKNLNRSRAQAAWAFPWRRWGELWFPFPKGTSQEANHAVVYNPSGDYWYDTPFDRTAGATPEVFPYPIMAQNDGANSILWQHDYGLDEVNGGETSPIQSYFETPVISLPNKGVDKLVRLSNIELDLKQSKQMTVTVTGRPSAREPDVPKVKAFNEGDSYCNVDEKRRQMRLRFTSDQVGGNFELGKTMLYLSESDGQ